MEGLESPVMGASRGATVNRSEEWDALTARTDQMAMRLNGLEITVKAMENAVKALRQEVGSQAKASGGQAWERVEAVSAQVKSLETSFCEFSSRVDRESKEARELVERAATKPATEGSADEIKNWVRETIVPEIHNSVIDSDRLDVVQAASTNAYDRVMEQIDTSNAATPEMVRRCSVPFIATVLRNIEDKIPGDTVGPLHHPIVKIKNVAYMHLLSHGPNASIEDNLFPVEDEDGPCVAFKQKNDA